MRLEMKPVVNALMFLAVVACGGCLADSASVGTLEVLPIYEDAFDLDKRNLEHGLSQQISYKVHKAFPSDEVLSFYDKYFQENGWGKCQGGIENWQSYVDATGATEYSVNQIAHYYMNNNGNKFSTVFLRYDSTNPKSGNKPDNDIQKVFILTYQNTNLRKLLNNLSVICDKK